MSLTYEVIRPDTRDLVEMLVGATLVPAGAPGGPDWTSEQQARLFASLESHWPTGQLLAWAPTGDRWQRRYLLDGHRRAATLLRLTAAGTGGLLRDLTADQPSYLPADRSGGGGVYLPVAAMLSTMTFLAATRSLPAAAVDRAARVATSIMHARFDLITLLGGTAAQVGCLCERLVPGRVDPILHASAARAHHADPPGPPRTP